MWDDWYHSAVAASSATEIRRDPMLRVHSRNENCPSEWCNDNATNVNSENKARNVCIVDSVEKHNKFAGPNTISRGKGFSSNDMFHN